MYKIIIGHIVLIILLSMTRIQAADNNIKMDSLYVDEDQLVIDFHIKNLLDEKTIEGLQRGFTSQVKHQVLLWKTTKLVSSIAAQVNHTIIIFYDNWENKFAIVQENEKRLTTNIERLQKQSSTISGIKLAVVANLDAESKYYISIQSSFQPMSDEAYNELRDWMSKKPVDPNKEDSPKKRGRFFGVFMDLMGFGDSNFNLKSQDFFVRNNSEIEFVD